MSKFNQYLEKLYNEEAEGVAIKKFWKMKKKFFDFLRMEHYENDKPGLIKAINDFAKLKKIELEKGDAEDIAIDIMHAED